MELREQNTYKHYQRSVTGECQYVLAIKDNPSAYEIGLKQVEDGSFELRWDPLDHAIEQAAGKNAMGLICEYGAQEYIRAQQLNGALDVVREYQPDGTLRLRAIYA
jgi:hypothetical protein